MGEIIEGYTGGDELDQPVWTRSPFSPEDRRIAKFIHVAANLHVGDVVALKNELHATRDNHLAGLYLVFVRRVDGDLRGIQASYNDPSSSDEDVRHYRVENTSELQLVAKRDSFAAAVLSSIVWKANDDRKRLQRIEEKVQQKKNELSELIK